MGAEHDIHLLKVTYWLLTFGAESKCPPSVTVEQPFHLFPCACPPQQVPPGLLASLLPHPLAPPPRSLSPASALSGLICAVKTWGWAGRWPLLGLSPSGDNFALSNRASHGPQPGPADRLPGESGPCPGAQQGGAAPPGREVQAGKDNAASDCRASPRPGCVDRAPLSPHAMAFFLPLSPGASPRSQYLGPRGSLFSDAFQLGGWASPLGLPVWQPPPPWMRLSSLVSCCLSKCRPPFLPTVGSEQALGPDGLCLALSPVSGLDGDDRQTERRDGQEQQVSLALGPGQGGSAVGEPGGPGPGSGLGVTKRVNLVLSPRTRM